MPLVVPGLGTLLRKPQCLPQYYKQTSSKSKIGPAASKLGRMARNGCVVMVDLAARSTIVTLLRWQILQRNTTSELAGLLLLSAGPRCELATFCRAAAQNQSAPGGAQLTAIRRRPKEPFQACHAILRPALVQSASCLPLRSEILASADHRVHCLLVLAPLGKLSVSL